MLRAANEDGKCALGTDVAVMGHCTLPIPITAVLPAVSPLGSGEDFQGVVLRSNNPLSPYAPQNLPLCISKIPHSYQTALQSANGQPLDSLPSAFISGSVWFKPIVSIKTLDF